MRTLREQIRLEENEALSFHDIQNILSNRCRNLHVKFTDLEAKGNYSLADILPTGANAGLVLLTARLSTGVNRHWVTFLKHRNGKISFYDPLALGPHTLSSYMNDNGRFAKFVRNIKANVNTRKHQQDKTKIKTCGLHAVVRMVAHATQDLTNGEFDHWLTSINMPADELVTLLTYIGHLSV